MIIKYTITLIIAFLVCSCASSNIESYNKIDAENKTITVPPGGGANAAIKKSLKDNGWSLKIDSTSLKTVGTNDKSINQVTTIESDTRYRLLSSFVTGDFSCLTCRCVKSYNISIIDNKTGEEVAILDGEGGVCYETLAQHVINALSTK